MQVVHRYKAVLKMIKMLHLTDFFDFLTQQTIFTFDKKQHHIYKITSFEKEVIYWYYFLPLHRAPAT